ncbi:MAG: hypothetical protein Q9171_004218 [Xanthocarpia ochracea]
MPAVVATLYRVVSHDLSHAQCKVSFPSTHHERISHYIHALKDIESGKTISISQDPEGQSPAVVLHTGQDLLEIEARWDSIWVKSYLWTNESSEPSFVRLQPSTPARQILHLLAPNEPFRIRDEEYLLQVDQAPPVQDVQVMSSRPSTDDADTPAMKEQGIESGLDNCSSTPNTGSGTAVLETPIAKRYRNTLELSKSFTASIGGAAIQDKPGIGSPPQSGSSTPTRDSTLATNPSITGRANADFAENTADLEPKSVVVETSLDVLPNDSASSQTTETSTQELPRSGALEKSEAEDVDPSEGHQALKGSSPAQQGPHKRSASPTLDEDDSKKGVRPVNSPSSKPSVGGSGLKGPPKKRQRLGSTTATEESQDSVKSTIQVELPSTIHPPARSRKGLLNDTKQPQESSKSTLSTPRNHMKSTEPPSSNTSSRSTRQVQRGQGSSQEQVTRVVYASSTSVGESTAYAKFLRQHNVKQVKNMSDCDVLCTGKGELKRTSKLLLAILRGTEVVTDQWVIQSVKQNRLLDTTRFVPEDSKREHEWGTSLSDAIKRGRKRLKPFEGWTINFTPSAKTELGKSWSELKEICLVAGATAVQAIIPRKSPAETDATVVIAASNEADQATLEARGWRCFSKDIITFSALRGGIDVHSDEFFVGEKENGSAKKKKAKKAR